MIYYKNFENFDMQFDNRVTTYYYDDKYIQLHKIK